MSEDGQVSEAGNWREETVALRMTWDARVDAGYLYLAESGDGQAVGQARVVNPVDGDLGDVVLDFDRQGRLLGVEFLGRRLLPPGLDHVAT